MYLHSPLRRATLGSLLAACMLFAHFVDHELNAGVRNLRAECTSDDKFACIPALMFSSTRDNPAGVGSGSTIAERIFNAAELYVMLMGEDGSRASEPLRLTNDQSGDGFAVLSPSGKQLLFDSNRNRVGGEPYQVSDLFVTSVDEYDPAAGQIPPDRLRHLTRGSSGSWSHDGRAVAFHASASGLYTTETLARSDPGTPAIDSDIVVMNVDDCLLYRDACAAKSDSAGALPPFLTNLTQHLGPNTMIDEDPDWSPDGSRIAFVRHDGEAGTFLDGADHNNTNAELYLIRPDGTGFMQLTENVEEERSPAWSPDGTLILYMCRRSDPPGNATAFQLCVLQQDALGDWMEVQLTNNGRPHLGPQWSPDGRFIVFQRPVNGQLQIFRLEFLTVDGVPAVANQIQLTRPPGDPGLNGFPSWDRLRVRSK